jgi:hypothetical protein
MIVLSYAPDDMMRVERFYRAFHEAGLKPWMDSIDRPPGALWERALSVAIRRCDLLIIFLSERSVDKHGLLRKEHIQALSDWEEKGADDVFVVLARLEACKVPDELANFQKFDALDELKILQLVRLLRSPNDGFWLQPIVLTATRSLISIEFYISTYRRGEAQRHHYTRTLNIDVENSTELSLKSLVHNEAMAMKFFSTYCENALRAEPDFHLTGKDWKFDSSGVSISQSFGFRNADLIFIFAPRDIGGLTFGRKVVELPFNDVHRFLTDRTIDLLVDQQAPADVDLGNV